MSFIYQYVYYNCGAFRSGIVEIETVWIIENSFGNSGKSFFDVPIYIYLFQWWENKSYVKRKNDLVTGGSMDMEQHLKKLKSLQSSSPLGFSYIKRPMYKDHGVMICIFK